MQAASVEVQMLANDARELRVLIDRLTAHKDSGVLGLGMTPLVSFVVVEAYECLRRAGAPVDPFLEANARRVRGLRARLKLTSDREGFEGGLNRLGAVQKASERMFFPRRTGLLARVRRWFQTDLGLYFSGSDLLCTTHVALADFGFSEEELAKFDPRALAMLGEEVRALAEHLGSFLAEQFYLPRDVVTTQVLPTMARVHHEDHKSVEAYAAIATRLGTDDTRIAAQFTYLVCHVNHAHIGLRCLIGSETDLFLRYSFLTVYYAARLLQIFGARTRGDTSTELAQLARALQERPGMRRVRHLKRLRQFIAHYDANGLSNLSAPERCLDQLVADMGNMDRSSLSAIIDDELEAMSERFRQIVSRGSLRKGLQQRSNIYAVPVTV